jgi:hypothetical protein
MDVRQAEHSDNSPCARHGLISIGFSGPASHNGRPQIREQGALSAEAQGKPDQGYQLVLRRFLNRHQSEGQRTHPALGGMSEKALRKLTIVWITRKGTNDIAPFDEARPKVRAVISSVHQRFQDDNCIGRLEAIGRNQLLDGLKASIHSATDE